MFRTFKTTDEVTSDIVSDGFGNKNKVHISVTKYAIDYELKEK